MKKNWSELFVKKMASLRLGVFILLAIAALTAIGTIIEAKYDAYAAKKLIYDTVWMYGIMSLLAINLIAVMVDRWPWKRRHVAFVSAHIGIIVLLLGSVLTLKTGIDGSLRVPIGKENNLAQVAETDLVVYSSFDGSRYSKMLDQEVDFFKKPPSESKPFSITTFNPDDEIKVIKYERYVVPSQSIVASEDSRSGAGLRFQIENANVNVVEWLVQTKSTTMASKDFGPAQIFLGEAPSKGQKKNEIYLSPIPNNKDQIRYTVFSKDQEKPLKTGLVSEGGLFDPGFKMSMNFRVLRYLPKAQQKWDVRPLEAPTSVSTSAVQIRFQGKDHWVLLNDMTKLFTENAVYLFSYGQRRIDIGFPLKLLEFTVDNYQGTRRAMAYKSKVQLPDQSIHEISMNEPLKYNGLTIYQASFHEEDGKPVASIFSVNKDPGRFWKYLGSLIISVGILVLMYFRHLDFKILKKKEGAL